MANLSIPPLRATTPSFAHSFLLAVVLLTRAVVPAATENPEDDERRRLVLVDEEQFMALVFAATVLKGKKNAEEAGITPDYPSYTLTFPATRFPDRHERRIRHSPWRVKCLAKTLLLHNTAETTMTQEKRERHVQESFGRATTLYPRTAELLEQLDVLDDMLQIGVTARSFVVFKDGKPVPRKSWQLMIKMLDNSYHDYILNLRQKRSEDVFVSKYKTDFGKSVYYGWELVDCGIDTSLGDGYNVTVEMTHATLGKKTVRCKYLVGADGGQSSVRRLSEIAMEGDDTPYQWVRLDGRMKTDMPMPDIPVATFETENHGYALWVKLEGDASRIGFTVTPALKAKYPNGLDQESAIQEAKNCLLPFHLEVERVDWWTLYTIRQKVAAVFQKDEYILLAGDAAHTHSSALAQGMNTAVHDATNLAWKLAGTLKGWYRPGVLASYAAERRAAAQKLIRIDKGAAAATSGDRLHDAGLSPAEVFHATFEANMSFTMGFGVEYDETPSVLNANANMNADAAADAFVNTTGTNLTPGTRSPDALLRGPGPRTPVRLHSITRNLSRKLNRKIRGRWSLLVFAGRPHLTRDKIASLREQLDPGIIISSSSGRSSSSTVDWRHLVNVTTIIAGATNSAWTAFDGPAPPGRLYFDGDGSAHDRYGVYPDTGALVLVRPDGILAFGAQLDGLGGLERYFAGICA
ncbi:FAD/NAD(P)-binding domain-containing protein [Xylariomycetidae sp. FL2044]|nr:FAD/NAD(P)-binding domain-containing protein [Xylariomycetidae sp. FL2044]